MRNALFLGLTLIMGSNQAFGQAFPSPSASGNPSVDGPQAQSEASGPIRRAWRALKSGGVTNQPEGDESPVMVQTSADGSQGQSGVTGPLGRVFGGLTSSPPTSRSHSAPPAVMGKSSVEEERRQSETMGPIRRVFATLRSGQSPFQSKTDGAAPRSTPVSIRLAPDKVVTIPPAPPPMIQPVVPTRSEKAVTATPPSLPMTQPALTSRMTPTRAVAPPSLPMTQPVVTSRMAPTKAVVVTPPSLPLAVPARDASERLVTAPPTLTTLPMTQPSAPARNASERLVTAPSPAPVTVRSAPTSPPALSTRAASDRLVTAGSLPAIEPGLIGAPPSVPSNAARSFQLQTFPGDRFTDGSYLELYEDEYTPQGQPWFSAEYLLWWITPGATPPLITTGNPADAFPGSLGQSGTRVLFGGERALDYGGISGMRLGTGIWLGPRAVWGLEGSGFFFEHALLGIAAASDGAGNPPLFVPFFRPELGREGSFTISSPVILNPVAQPGFLLGGVSIDSNTRFWGTEGNIVRSLVRTSNCRVDFLLGFRYLDLSDALTLGGNALMDPTTGIQASFFDRFETSNQLYAGQIGGRFSYQGERLSLDFLPKLALGSNREVINVNGAFTQTGAILGPLQGTFPGGVLTQTSNLGRRSADQFAVVPQLQAKIGYNIRPRVRATVGYDFLYWNQVVRAGDQIDRAVNVTQSVPLGVGTLIGPANPAPLFDRTDFIAHGVSFGLELRY